MEVLFRSSKKKRKNILTGFVSLSLIFDSLIARFASFLLQDHNEDSVQFRGLIFATNTRNTIDVSGIWAGRP